MPAYITRRYLTEYRTATDNEIATDLLFLRHADKRPEAVGFIPRVPLWLNRFSSNPLVTLWFSGVAGFIWQILAGLPFHLLKATQLLIRLRHVEPDEKQRLQNIDEVGLAFSQRAIDVVTATEVLAPGVWIVPPWVSVDRDSRSDISMLCFVSARDIAQAFWLAVLSTLVFGRDAKRRPWILQTYTAVPWFLTRIALSRVDVDFVMANHFDRWAVLADMTIRAWRRLGRKERRLTLIQHGYVGDMDGQKGRILPPYKLAAVSRLYVYDDASDALFRTEILSPGAVSHLVSHRFTPRIVLTPVAATDALKVLFVGHPLCADLQVAVLAGLKKEAIMAFYKPHPTAGLPNICRDRRWEIISDRSIFPDVDIVVSYRSTLVTEYEQHNIKSIIHRLTNNIEECDDILESILDFMRER